DVPVLAFPFEFVGGPDLRQHGDGLFPQAARVPGIDAQAGLLIGVGAARAQLDAAIGELVQYGHTLGDTHRVMIWQDAHAVADADLLGDTAEGTKERVLAR